MQSDKWTLQLQFPLIANQVQKGSGVYPCSHQGQGNNHTAYSN